jgi:predicted DNA-binding transcriptional regulator AlpA
MSNIQFIQVTPQDLAEMISEAVFKRIDALSIKKPISIKESPKELLTRKELKEMLGISYPAIYKRIQSGAIKKRMMGNKPYFYYSEIIDHLNSTNLVN